MASLLSGVIRQPFRSAKGSMVSGPSGLSDNGRVRLGALGTYNRVWQKGRIGVKGSLATGDFIKVGGGSV